MYFDEESPIIIVGMHRSGTTLVSQKIKECGVNTGISVDDNNESKFFQGINKIILSSAGLSWDNINGHEYLFEKKTKKMIKEYIGNKINGIESIIHFGISRHNKKSWGWKDPRTSILLPIWLEIFPNAKIINVERHGIDVAKSLTLRSQKVMGFGKYRLRRDEVPFINKVSRSREGFSPRCSDIDRALELWSEYMMYTRLYCKSHDNLTIKYEEFLNSPNEIFNKVVDFIGCNKITTNKIIVDPSKAYAYKNYPLEFSNLDKVELLLNKYGYGV